MQHESAFPSIFCAFSFDSFTKQNFSDCRGVGVRALFSDFSTQLCECFSFCSQHSTTKRDFLLLMIFRLQLFSSLFLLLLPRFLYFSIKNSFSSLVLTHKKLFCNLRSYSFEAFSLLSLRVHRDDCFSCFTTQFCNGKRGWDTRLCFPRNDTVNSCDWADCRRRFEARPTHRQPRYL